MEWKERVERMARENDFFSVYSTFRSGAYDDVGEKVQACDGNVLKVVFFSPGACSRAEALLLSLGFSCCSRGGENHGFGESSVGICMCCAICLSFQLIVFGAIYAVRLIAQLARRPHDAAQTAARGHAAICED